MLGLDDRAAAPDRPRPRLASPQIDPLAVRRLGSRPESDMARGRRGRRVLVSDLRTGSSEAR